MCEKKRNRSFRGSLREAPTRGGSPFGGLSRPGEERPGKGDKGALGLRKEERGRKHKENKGESESYSGGDVEHKKKS